MDIHHNKNIMNALITEIECHRKLTKYFNRYFFMSSFYAGILKGIFYFLIATFSYFLIIQRAETEGLYPYLLFFMIAVFPFLFGGIEYIYNNRFYAYGIKTEKRLCCEFENLLSQNKINFTRMKSKMEPYEFAVIATILLNKTTDIRDIIENVRKFKNINFRTKKKKELLNKESQIIFENTAASLTQPVIPHHKNSQDKKSRLHTPFFSNEGLSSVYGDFYRRWQMAWFPIYIVTFLSFMMNTQQVINDKSREYFITALTPTTDKESAIISLNKYNTIYKSRIHVTNKNNQLNINALNDFVWDPVIALTDTKITISNMTLNNRPIDISKNSYLHKILSSDKDKMDKKEKLIDYLKELSLQENNVLVIDYY